MPSLTPAYLDAIRLNPTDASAFAVLGTFRGRQELFRRQTPEVLEGLRNVALVESSESSNRIEGVVAPHDRVEAMVLRNSTPANRSEQEIAGYRDALALIHESGREMTFSVNLVLQLHSLLYRYQSGRGGQWKATDNEIVERDASGRVTRVRFVPPGPVAVPQLMADLTDNHRAARDAGRDPLILIPLVVLDFLSIHPLSDGNGRTGRLLSLMLLYQGDFEVGRFISLERIIEESKETYYEALERSSVGWHEDRHDPLPWMRYFWGVLIAAYKEFEERVGTIRVGRGSKEDVVEQAIARQVTPFSISDILADSPGVSRDWVKLLLRRLRDEGRIELIGRGRGAKWVRVENRG
ncbi:MAG: Fic family protein [Gemmatimonadetes bacterium]|nr:Fic family protein [Gemmatimonadota bacterium]